MLEKINHKTAPKEVVYVIISLYNKGDLEQILKMVDYLASVTLKFCRLYFGHSWYYMDIQKSQKKILSKS